MASTLNGRFGAYKPRNDHERAQARKQALQQRQKAASLSAWLERHKVCANGCGQPVAFYDTINFALRFSGCCSAECEADMQARERIA